MITACYTKSFSHGITCQEKFTKRNKNLQKHAQTHAAAENLKLKKLQTSSLQLSDFAVKTCKFILTIIYFLDIKTLHLILFKIVCYYKGIV